MFRSFFPEPKLFFTSLFVWAAICVTGPGHSDEELRAIGEELSRRVVQKYVYQRLTDEIKARQFVVVEEEVDENQAIRLKVRHWDG